MTGERRVWSRIAYGPPRKPLEPYRPWPWLFRIVSWTWLALACLAFAVTAVLRIAKAAAIAWEVVAWSGLTLVLLAVFARWMSAYVRPTPLVLAPYDEEA